MKTSCHFLPRRVSFRFILMPLRVFKRNLAFYCSDYPLETQLQEGMLITMHTKTTEIHLVNLARAMKDA